MRALMTTTLLGVALAALPLSGHADDAKARGSSRPASSAGARHPSSSGHAQASHPGSSNSGNRGGYYSASSSRNRGGGGYTTGAQARHPRPGTGHGTRYPGAYYGYGHGRYPYYGYGGYYSPWWGWGFYGGWGYPYGWGAYGGWGYPYYGYGGYGSYGYYDAEIGSLRLIVEPNKTRVYVDGSYAGLVDEFDGIFQSLKLPRGRHDIALKLDGYETHRMRVYVTPSHKMKIRYDMVKGSGDSFEDLTRDTAEADEPPRIQAPGPMAPPPPSEGAEGREPASSVRAEAMGPGTLVLDVRPGDAAIYIDGEFRGAAGGLERLTLPSGRHLLEVVRPGYRTVQREIEIRPGKSESVAVDLERS